MIENELKARPISFFGRAQKWLNRNPQLAAMFALLCLSTLTLVFLTISMQLRLLIPRQSVKHQLTQLEIAEQALNDLSAFVQKQKFDLKESEAILQSLRSESAKLKPVVEADKKMVEAVLAAHSQSQVANVWKDQLIGFVIGVASSIAAVGLVAFASFSWRKFKRRKENRPFPAEPI